ncbi:ATP-grasp domain-containing protein [candidate division CSSED10-310 bacterium]|uniref:ATP-grasp domain-containing protein n=1 Tax=candidate division CSSED10-310 bacterium TaxID=2855610 RepID=A0ABV6YTC8_UNCC1
MKVKKQKILILGASTWQIPLHQQAQAMGLEVISMDPYLDAPALKFAHEIHHVDLRDVENVYEIVAPLSIDGVVTGADLAVPAAAYISKRLRLPGISVQAAYCATNKIAMRKKAQMLGVNIPEFKEIQNVHEAQQAFEKLGAPCVMKPAHNCGARGVIFAPRESDLYNAFSEAKKASFGGPVIIEEYIAGTEYSVETFTDSTGNISILGIGLKEIDYSPYFITTQICYPAPLNDALKEKAEKFVTMIVKEFELNLGYAHTEIILKDNQFYLIETAARGGGAYISGKLMPVITGVNLVEKQIEMALGNEVILPSISSMKAGLIQFILPPPYCRITSLEVPQDIMKEPGILDFNLDLNIGDQIGAIKNTSHRCGHIILAGESISELTPVLKSLLNQIQISGI